MVNNQRFFCRFVVYCPATMDVTLRNETWRGRVLDLSRALTAHEQVAAASWHPCLGALVDLASRVRDAVLTLDGMALLAPRRVTLIGLHHKHYAQARGLRAEIMACLTGLGMMLTGQTPRCQSPDVNFEELLGAVQALVDVVSDL